MTDAGRGDARISGLGGWRGFLAATGIAVITLSAVSVLIALSVDYWVGLAAGILALCAMEAGLAYAFLIPAPSAKRFVGVAIVIVVSVSVLQLVMLFFRGVLD